MKKGEMSLQVIVVAVIVLLIAAILIYLVGSKLGIFSDNTGCEGQGGRCQAVCGAGEINIGLGCDREGDKCCKPSDEVLGIS